MWCSFSQTVVQSSGESAAPDYALPASGPPGAARKEGGGCAGPVRGSRGRPLPAPGRGLLVTRCWGMGGGRGLGPGGPGDSGAGELLGWRAGGRGAEGQEARGALGLGDRGALKVEAGGARGALRLEAAGSPEAKGMEAREL